MSDNSAGAAMQRILDKVPEEYVVTRHLIEQMRDDAADQSAEGISEEAFAAAVMGAVLGLEKRIARLEGE